MRLHRPRRLSMAAGAAVAVLCVLAGCGTSSTPTQSSPPAATTAAPTAAASTTAAPSTTTASAPPAACADVAALKSSLEALTQVKPAEDGVPALKAAIADVKTNLTAAETSVSDALQPSVEQVKIAFGNLQTATAGLTNDNRREKAPEIAAAMKQVRTATTELSSTLTETCP